MELGEVKINKFGQLVGDSNGFGLCYTVEGVSKYNGLEELYWSFKI